MMPIPTLDASPSRCRSLWASRVTCAALWALLLGPASQAFAATLTCGSYQTTDGHAELIVESPTRAIRRSSGMTPTPYLIQQHDQTLEVTDLSAGFSSEYSLSVDGTTISYRFNDYALTQAATCKPTIAAPAGSCRADIGQCITHASNATPAQLQQWCSEDLPFACNQLLENYQQAASATAADDPELIEPDVCKENSAAFDEQRCRDAASEVMGKAMAKMLLGGLNPANVVLASPQLAELMQLCRRHPNGDFCSSVAEAHWDAGLYLLARDAFELACSPGAHPNACDKAAGLATLRSGDQDAAPASELPCGDYRAASGLMDELSFGDRGLVALSLGSQLRARLDNGRVHLRHDKGDDFVFRLLAGQRLLGIDQWNRYALYQRDGGAEHCSAPVVYAELPLQQDCPTGAAQACCDAGRMQGCNAMGHQNALSGDWQAAAPYYLKMCSAGVRAGCENLVSVYGNTGDDRIPEAIADLCKSDANGTHVACDIEATSNWPMLGLGAAFDRAAQEIENAGDADEPTAPQSRQDRRKSLKK